MKTVIKKSFSNQELQLDNTAYVECTFESCLLTYSAKGEFCFSGNIVSPDCKFEVLGQAANTIAALQDLYDLGGWGQSRVLATFNQIVGKSESLPIGNTPEQLSDDSLGYLVPED